MTSVAPPSLPETITTARLTLRRPVLADAPEVLARWAADPEVTRYLLFPTYAPDDIPGAERFLTLCLDNWRDGVGHRPWVLCEHGGDGRAIGILGVTQGVAPHAWEVGYALGRAWWQRGLMREAVSAVVATLFSDPRVWRVFAPTHVDNAASQRLLARCGFSREAIVRRFHVFPNLAPEPQDGTLWALTRDDLLAARARREGDPTISRGASR